MERFTCREDKVSVSGALAERACSVWTLTAGTLATAGIRLQVLPKQGFKSCGMRVGKELLQPEVPVWGRELVEQSAFGTCLLFPTPNRVRDHSFMFQGRRVEMLKHGKPCTQHGIAMDSLWTVTAAGTDDSSAYIAGMLVIAPGDENYRAFPFPCRVEAAYHLQEGALFFRYRVQNTGETRMPFGIGLHPWFLAPEDLSDTLLQVCADFCYETTPDLLPTGRLLDVRKEGGKNLNPWRRLKELDLDTVYRNSRLPAKIYFGHSGYMLVITASKEFRHTVVFTPCSRGLIRNGKGLFCLETQTCCTDAINLWEQGVPDTGLLVLEPGQSQSGWIRYELLLH